VRYRLRDTIYWAVFSPTVAAASEAVHLLYPLTHLWFRLRYVPWSSDPEQFVELWRYVIGYAIRHERLGELVPYNLQVRCCRRRAASALCSPEAAVHVGGRGGR
jgi:hypothetical protein